MLCLLGVMSYKLSEDNALPEMPKKTIRIPAKPPTASAAPMPEMAMSAYALQYSCEIKRHKVFAFNRDYDYEAEARAFKKIMERLGFETQIVGIGYDFSVVYWTDSAQVREFLDPDVASLWQLRLMEYGCKVKFFHPPKTYVY